MTISQFVKGLCMVLISVAVTFFSQVPVDYALLAVTAVATVLAYSGKNLIGLLSTSDPGKLNLINFFSALLVALATGITESVAMLVVDGKILWIVLLKVVGSVTLTYLAGTLFAGPTVKSKKLFAK
jgi:hypothetical protein